MEKGVTRSIPDKQSWKRVELTTAHKMHDLEPVAVPEAGLRPSRARNDLAVQLYGNPIRLHPQVLYERFQGERIGEITSFAVDMKFHLREFSQA